MRRPVLLSPLLLFLACSPTPASSPTTERVRSVPVEEMDPQLRTVYTLRLGSELEGALTLAATAGEDARSAGEGLLAARFGCAHALLRSELDRSVESAREELAAGTAALRGAPAWMRAECLLADLSISAADFDFSRAARAAAEAYQITQDSPHPDPERAVAIVSGHAAMLTRSDLAAGIELMDKAVELERSSGSPACPNLAATLVVAGSLDYAAGRYEEARKKAEHVQTACGGDENRLLRARGHELLAMVSMSEGDTGSALAYLEGELPFIDKFGTTGDRDRFAMVLSELYEKQGRTEDARAMLQGRIAASSGAETRQLARRTRLLTLLLFVESSAQQWVSVLDLAEKIEAARVVGGASPDDKGRSLIAYHKCRALLHLHDEKAKEACRGLAEDLEADDPEAAAFLRASR